MWKNVELFSRMSFPRFPPIVDVFEAILSIFGPRCPRCRRLVPRGIRICPHCGAILDKSLKQFEKRGNRKMRKIKAKAKTIWRLVKFAVCIFLLGVMVWSICDAVLTGRLLAQRAHYETNIYISCFDAHNGYSTSMGVPTNLIVWLFLLSCSAPSNFKRRNIS